MDNYKNLYFVSFQKRTELSGRPNICAYIYTEVSQNFWLVFIRKVLNDTSQSS